MRRFRGFLATFSTLTLLLKPTFSQLTSDSATTTTSVSTGKCSPVTWMPDGFIGPEPSPRPPEDFITYRAPIQPGEINCRATFEIDNGLDANTCVEKCRKYGITLEKLFFLNPELKGDCANMKEGEEYCYAGFIEPLRAYDGRCGPPNKNATCIGVPQGQCCNSETWTCGQSDADCAKGTCYEGICWGHKVYTTDGSCGAQHSDRKCAGKWGECCSNAGRCGSGDDFCGVDVCQSGNCKRRPPPVLDGNTLDGTCGGEKGYTCNVVFGYCCSKDGVCGSEKEDCGEGCQPEFGMCGEIRAPPVS